ncbi:nuclear transport factor 2 family protein [Amycolatopsis sp. EV170708-02-1]|uniref:nuclear transport factor 2 family protein n=1 Tax=Amycolatopsis sp. EV170708-02-1 TaxID=2919322 RepID=UPI001F0C3098|nr:nuclear transport factor 2 family protein [Amycolatopsis sp. EV170708-02-1]UMP05113.1 nuclear transport factor 2 family protein [Amycolatopsis sp. EV170708-02-1]
MSDDVAGQVIKAERDRIRCLLDVDRAAYDRLHAAEYRLCNPTGTVWSKAEYLDLLATGRVAYRELELAGDMDAIVGTDVVVLRYRCVIELTVDGADIPRHEAWHTDVYTDDGGTWRCVWSQATGIMGLPSAAP